MRKFLLTLLLGLGLILPAQAEGPVALQQVSFSTVTTGPAILVRGTGAS